MVHQIFGGIGAYAGALVFDHSGSYDAAFVALAVASAVGLVLALMLRAPKPLATSSASARSSP
jgi:predicted MFS family arabinose efflux permease